MVKVKAKKAVKKVTAKVKPVAKVVKPVKKVVKKVVKPARVSGKGRGFASMPKDKQALIASRGGIAAHKKGTAHEWNSKEAKIAGKLGGRWKRNPDNV